VGEVQQQRKLGEIIINGRLDSSRRYEW